MINYSTCPLCGDTDIVSFISTKDNTVSKENFSIFKCNACTALFTQDVEDKDDISKYYASEDYISHSDTKQGFINNLYHRVRQRTLVQKRKLILNKSGKNTGKILDIGCGTGAFLKEMIDSGWSATGLEPDAAARSKAQKLYGLNPQPADDLYNLPPQTFDVITMWHVLEHVHDLQGYLTMCQNLLTKKGILIIAVPNYTSKDAEYYSESWAAYDVPRHLYHFSPKSMRQLLNRHSFSLEEMKPMWFDSFYVSLLSEKYKNGKSNMPSALWQGIKSNLAAMKDPERGSSIIYLSKKMAQQD